VTDNAIEYTWSELDLCLDEHGYYVCELGDQECLNAAWDACLDVVCSCNSGDKNCEELYECRMACGEDLDCHLVCGYTSTDQANDTWELFVDCLDLAGYFACSEDDDSCLDMVWDSCNEAFVACVGCIPDCEGKECGDDGCGGACGQCPQNETCVGGVCLWSAGCPMDLTGKTYRVTDFLVDVPSNVMNESWEQDIAVGDLVLLLRVAQHNVATGELTLFLGSGKATIETQNGQPVFTAFAFALAPSETAAIVDADCKIVLMQSFLLELLTANANKPLAIKVLSGTAKLSPNGMNVVTAQLSGGIQEVEVFDFCLNIPGLGTANLHWFFNLAHICPSTDFDADGAPEAYAFEATFKAEATELFVPGIQPVESKIAQCVVHDLPCVQ